MKFEMENPRVLESYENEFWKLSLVADMLEMFSPNKAEYIVQDVYFDLGQKWMWTTIVRRGFRECQILSPRDWSLIINSESISELYEAIQILVSDKYWGDK